MCTVDFPELELNHRRPLNQINHGVTLFSALHVKYKTVHNPRYYIRLILNFNFHDHFFILFKQI